MLGAGWMEETGTGYVVLGVFRGFVFFMMVKYETKIVISKAENSSKENLRTIRHCCNELQNGFCSERNVLFSSHNSSDAAYIQRSNCNYKFVSERLQLAWTSEARVLVEGRCFKSNSRSGWKMVSSSWAGAKFKAKFRLNLG